MTIFAFSLGDSGPQADQEYLNVVFVLLLLLITCLHLWFEIFSLNSQIMKVGVIGFVASATLEGILCFCCGFFENSLLGVFVSLY